MGPEIQTYIAAASAFVGAMAGTGMLSWWLATRFNNVYMRMTSMENSVKERMNAVEKVVTTRIDDHEKLDIERFNRTDLAIMKLEMKIGDYDGRGGHIS